MYVSIRCLFMTYLIYVPQTCRNNLLEKRQRKFDGELHAAQEELKRERGAKERLSREREQAHAEKYALEQSLSVRTHKQ